MVRAAVAALLAALAAGQTPVAKVISMMEDLREKSARDMQQEEVNMARFNQWCKQTGDERDAAISESEETIQQCDADIESGTITANELSNQINGHNGDIATWKKDQEASTFVRGKESSDYLATNSDYDDTAMAINKAIRVLRARDVKIKQEALLQVASSRLVAPSEREYLQAFLQAKPEGEDTPDLSKMERGQAYAYESKSGGVIDMLEKLKQKFGAEQRKLQKEEQLAKNNYDQMMQTLTSEISRAERNVERKSKERGEAQEKAAEAKRMKVETQQTKESDETYRSELTQLCATRAEEFPKRMALRKEEQEALAKAIEIIKDPTVAGVGEKHLPTLLQTGRRELSPNMEKAIEVLQDDADRLGSKRLELLSERMQASPFKKVTKMIEQMIFNLKQEALEEAEKHGWCTAELAANGQTRKSKGEQVEELTADLEEVAATISQTKEENAKLSKEIADANAALAEAEKLRMEEKAKNEQTIAESKGAQEAVERALAILREFYERAAEATSLTQKAGDDAPVTWESSFKAQQNSKTGVIGMLEVVQSDFARLESETSAEEEASDSKHREFVQESNVDIATKSTSVQMNMEKIARLEDQRQVLKKDLDGTQAELDAANKYYDKLKPTCVTTPVSYEERVQMREEEIQSLKEALSILEQSSEAAAGSAGN